jgi:hypothetical protein
VKKKNPAPIPLGRSKSFLPSAVKENSAHVTTRIFFEAAFQRKLRPHPRKYLKLPAARPHAMFVRRGLTAAQFGLSESDR